VLYDSTDLVPSATGWPLHPCLPCGAEDDSGPGPTKYTVATDGSTKDIEIIESSDPIFENESIELGEDIE
jgi:hypothetical protein